MKEKRACKWPRFVLALMILLVLSAGSIMVSVDAATISVVAGELITLPKFTDTQYLLEGKTYELRYMGLDSVSLPFYTAHCSEGWGTGTLQSKPPPSVFIKLCDITASWLNGREIEVTSADSDKVVFRFTIPPTPTPVPCSDTDGGLMPLTYGTCTDGAGAHPDYCTGSTLTDYYCVGTQCLSWTYNCISSYGGPCTSGRCITATPTPSPTPSNLLSCSAYSDGAVIPVYYNDGKTDTQSCQAAGHEGCYFHCCGSSTCTNVDPNYCGTNVCNDDFSGYACCRHGSGAPSPTPSPTPVCTDTDGGNNIYIRGTCTSPGVCSGGCTDSCGGGSTIHEDVCVGGACTLMTQSCPSGYTCSGGACVSITATPTPTPTSTPLCTDTDGGQLPLTFGTCVDPSGTHQDHCVVGNTLTEYYCLSNFCSSWSYNCVSYFGGQCSGGKCTTPTPTPIPTSTPYCGDSQCTAAIGETTFTCCKDCGCPPSTQNSCCDRSYYSCNDASCLSQDSPNNARCQPYEYCKSNCACISNVCSSYLISIDCNANAGCRWCSIESRCKTTADVCATPTPTSTPTATPTPAGIYCGDLKCSPEIGESQSSCCTDCGCPAPVQAGCNNRIYVCTKGVSCVPSDVPDNSRCASWEYCRSDGTCISNACSSYSTGIGCNTNPGCSWCQSEGKCKTKAETCASSTPTPTPTPAFTPTQTPQPESTPSVGSCGVFCGNAGDCGPCQRCTGMPANYKCEPDAGCTNCGAKGGCGETNAGNWPESCDSICGKFGLVCERTASCGSSCIGSGSCNDVAASCSNGATGMELGCVCKKKEQAMVTPTTTPEPATDEYASAQAAISTAGAAISSAETQVVQASREGREVDTAVRKIGEAKQFLTRASSSVATGHYGEAEDLAQSASLKASEAVGLIPAAKAGNIAVIVLVIVTILILAGIGTAIYFAFLKPKKPKPITAPAPGQGWGQSQSYYYRRY